MTVRATSSSAPQDLTAPTLAGFVRELPNRGSFSLWYGPLRGAPWLSWHDNVPHYAASTMKLALVLAAFRCADAGRLELNDTVPVHETFRSAYDGSEFGMDREDDNDPEPWRRIGEHVALRWLAYRAIVASSNLATNLLLERAGLSAVAEALAVCGTERSVVARGIEDTEASRAGVQNLVTAADLARTLQALAAETAASPAACREILAVLAAQQVNAAIPAGLPAGTRVAHKSGWVEGVSHDAGIVYPEDADPFVFAMCTTSELSEEEALRLIAEGAAAAWADRPLR